MDIAENINDAIEQVGPEAKKIIKWLTMGKKISYDTWSTIGTSIKALLGIYTTGPVVGSIYRSLAGPTAAMQRLGLYARNPLIYAGVWLLVNMPRSPFVKAIDGLLDLIPHEDAPADEMPGPPVPPGHFRQYEHDMSPSAPLAIAPPPDAMSQSAPTPGAVPREAAMKLARELDIKPFVKNVLETAPLLPLHPAANSLMPSIDIYSRMKIPREHVGLKKYSEREVEKSRQPRRMVQKTIDNPTFGRAGF